MAEFLVSKQDNAAPTGWRPVTVVTATVPTSAEEWGNVVRQGYQGPGRYALARWDTRREHDLRPGAVDVTDV